MNIAFYDKKFYLEADESTNKFRLKNFQERNINIICIFFTFDERLAMLLIQ